MSELKRLARRIAAEVAEQLAADQREAEQGGRPPLEEDDERVYARSLIDQTLEVEASRRLREGVGMLCSRDEEEVAEQAHAALYGLGPLQRYLDDPRVVEINVNAPDVVWLVYADGSKQRGERVADSDEELTELLRTAAAREGHTERRFDPASPDLDLQLRDGSRLFALRDLCIHPVVAIRKHQFELASLGQLRELGTLGGPPLPPFAQGGADVLPAHVAAPASVDRLLETFLRAAVLAKRSILIAGEVGSGKTTLMRALINEIPGKERLITIEDPRELGIERLADGGEQMLGSKRSGERLLHPDVVSLEARRPNIEGQGGIGLDLLVRVALRLNPDRVFVGEVRGAEALPMLMAMSQGQNGSMCTIHAKSVHDAIRKLQEYAKLSHQLDLEDTALLAANALDLIVHLVRIRQPDGTPRRVISGVLEVVGAQGPNLATNEVFRRGPDGRPQPTGVLGRETGQALAAVGFEPGWLAPEVVGL